MVRCRNWRDITFVSGGIATVDALKKPVILSVVEGPHTFVVRGHRCGPVPPLEVTEHFLNGVRLPYGAVVALEEPAPSVPLKKPVNPENPKTKSVIISAEMTPPHRMSSPNGAQRQNGPKRS
jgi:hypothetical protein